MIKKILGTAMLMISSLFVQAQMSTTFDIVEDEQTKQNMYVGRCTFDDISDEPTFDWLRMGSDAYNPDETILQELKEVLPSCEIVIFMGTWCEDTRNLLPKLYKTMLLSRCFTNYKMYAVDRSKKSKNNEQERFNIVNVPTIILMKNGTELGRIVEVAKKSIEADLLTIAGKK